MNRVHVTPADPELAWRLMRQYIADIRPGWTLEYIDSMSWADVRDLLAYASGKAKAQEE